jgi:hypothetical protein
VRKGQLVTIDKHAVRTAAKAYAAACRELREAEDAANAAWDRLETSPSTIEYQIDWNVARKHEAEMALKRRHAEQALRAAGSDPNTGAEEQA